MRKYELLTIIKPSIDLDEADKVVAKVGEIVTGLKGTVLDTEKMGRKKLAYDVKGFRDGYMVNQKLNLPEEQVKELRRQLKLNENIIRAMFSQAK